jgi:hypothetical protein
MRRIAAAGSHQACCVIDHGLVRMNARSRLNPMGEEFHLRPVFVRHRALKIGSVGQEPVPTGLLSRVHASHARNHPSPGLVATFKAPPSAATLLNGWTA